MKSLDKGYIGIAMEGIIAKWYAKSTKKSLREYRKSARVVAEQLRPGS